MIRSFYFFLRYGVFWLVYFFVARLVFVLYNFDLYKTLSVRGWFEVFKHGFMFDLFVTGYILIVIGLILTISAFFNSKISRNNLQRITFLIVLIFTLVIVVDFELYRNWGFRMNTTPLFFIRYPREAAASTTIWMYLGLFVLFLILFVSALFFFKRFFLKSLPVQNLGKSYFAIVFIFIIVLMIFPVRRTLFVEKSGYRNESFSENILVRHAALNEVWNLGNSIKEFISDEKVYNLIPDEEALNIFKNLHENKIDEGQRLLNSNRPNILIIVLESFTSNVIKVLGGEANVTPNLNQLSREGILFNHIYASGTRSEKGLAAILAGYPAQTGPGIMMYPEKVKSLPGLAKSFNNAGYTSKYYYAGDIDFANMKIFLTNMGFEKVMSKDDFSLKGQTSRWGAYDQVLFDTLLSDINRSNNPFFKVAFTLSSHEPFDVPFKSEFTGKDPADKFRNSIKYTDRCLGQFIKKAKKEAWWENTLIILIADHGHRLPGKLIYSEEKSFRIPMLWLGGALQCNDTIINKIGSQIDLVATLLKQLNINSDAFSFSKNLLTNSQEYALYVFAEGFAFITPDAMIIRNNDADSYYFEEGNHLLAKKQGEACFQITQNDFLKR